MVAWSPIPLEPPVSEDKVNEIEHGENDLVFRLDNPEEIADQIALAIADDALNLEARHITFAG